METSKSTFYQSFLFCQPLVWLQLHLDFRKSQFVITMSTNKQLVGLLNESHLSSTYHGLNIRLRLSTQLGYIEFSIQLLHGAVTLQPNEFHLHFSIKVHTEIITNER